MAYRHIVVFQLWPTADVEAVVACLRALAQLPGVADWRVEVSDDSRKGPVVVQNALFTSRTAFDDFRAHPQHVHAAELLATQADWLVADYEE